MASTFIENAIAQIQKSQLETATSLGKIDANMETMQLDVSQLKRASQKNTGQITVINEKLSKRRPTGPTGLVAIIKTLLPYIATLLVGAAAVGALLVK